jgi:large repetitive protein
VLRTVTGSEWRIGVRSLIALWLLFLACANWAAVAPSVRAVENQAFADFGDSNSKLASNIVRAMIFSGPPVIRYFSSNSFATPTNVATTGSPLFVQADAAACNVSRTTVETRTIVITSALTGDSESFLATESDADSGLFRILPNVPLRNSAIAVAGDKIIQTIQNDVLTASIDGCGAGFGTTTILIDPSGIVFDSKTNRPIAGASVQLIDAVSRKPATVLGADGVSAASSSVITGADGRFQFPAVSSGDYKLLIIPPGGYRDRIAAERPRHSSRGILRRCLHGFARDGRRDI